MLVSDLAVTRPVLSAVVALLLVIFGAVAYIQLPLREYPDIDPQWSRSRPLIRARQPQ